MKFSGSMNYDLVEGPSAYPPQRTGAGGAWRGCRVYRLSNTIGDRLRGRIKVAAEYSREGVSRGGERGARGGRKAPPLPTLCLLRKDIRRFTFAISKQTSKHGRHRYAGGLHLALTPHYRWPEFKTLTSAAAGSHRRAAAPPKRNGRNKEVANGDEPPDGQQNKRIICLVD
ncbi:hypothetical protein EVAR_2527_1 [Eumeta japonica]|uniref:Uncharacterized protein n=1 Tax=Eumeta variegata TaxID=151549 RepID=A0A4C1SNZ8_EUMVA|nr:hypothetical protein EVAR_2527_1 [Eumeta japonica]